MGLQVIDLASLGLFGYLHTLFFRRTGFSTSLFNANVLSDKYEAFIYQLKLY